MGEKTTVDIRTPHFVGRLWAGRGQVGHWLARQLVPNLGTLLLVGILLWVSGVYAAPDNASPMQVADTSFTTVNYQGRLADNLGNPINDTVSLTFALYVTEAGGTSVWSESHGAVPVSDGLFSVRLGQIIPLSTDLLAENLWLEIQVDTDPPMTPREKLAAVPYALRSAESDSSAWAMTRVGSGEVTKTDTSFTQIPDMQLSFELTEPRDIVAIFSGGVTNLSVTKDSVLFRLVVDGVEKARVGPNIHTVKTSVPIAIHWGETLNAGSHSISVEWAVRGGTGRFLAGSSPAWEQRVLSVMAFDTE